MQSINGLQKDSINVEISPFLNATADNHRHIHARYHQSAEGLAYRLGYGYGETVQPYLLELRSHLIEAWYQAHAEMPLMQIWGFWADDDSIQQQVERCEGAYPDDSHELSDVAVCVFPEVPLIREAVDKFFAARGIRATGDRPWQDFRGLQINRGAS